jgi:hypothetical protein
LIPDIWQEVCLKSLQYLVIPNSKKAIKIIPVIPVTQEEEMGRTEI